MINLAVTRLINSYKHFSRDFWLQYKALEAVMNPTLFDSIKTTLMKSKRIDPKYLEQVDIAKFELKKAEIDADWILKSEEAKAVGTSTHEYLHNLLCTDLLECQSYGIPTDLYKVQATENFINSDGLFPEFRMEVKLDDEYTLVGVADLIIKDGNRVRIIDYKGLPLNTPIMTTKGWSTMEKLKEGDFVFDKNGNPTKILHKSKVHYNPCYKIFFDNGESIVADENHLWEVSYQTNTNVFRTKYKTTKELFLLLPTIRRKSSTTIPKILNPNPINMPKADLPVDPYVLGCWLGDGSKNLGRITNCSNNIWGEIQARGYKIGPDTSSKNRCETRTVYKLIGQLKKAGVVPNKNIPDLYLTASYEQRLDLLRGLMDTDGYYHKTRKRFVMVTGLEWQRDGMIKLLGSLGIKSTVFQVYSKCNGKQFIAWNITFSTNGLNPFLSRNLEILYCSNNTPKYRNISKVEKVDMVPTLCIEVDSLSHTYLFGNSMIVTHNCSDKIEMKSRYDMAKKKKASFAYPIQSIEDCNYNEYSLQLSIYSWMLRQLIPDIEIVGLDIYHIQDMKLKKIYPVTELKKEIEKLIPWHLKSIKLKKATEECREIIY